MAESHIRLSEKKPDTRVHTAWYYLDKAQAQAESITGDRCQSSDYLSLGVKAGKSHEGIFWGTGNILNLSRGGDLPGYPHM